MKLEEFAAFVAGLPEVVDGEKWHNRTWSVAGKGFAWERPFSKADIRRFGAEPVPDGPIVALKVEDLGEKESVLAANPKGFFTIPHFDGYAAVLVQLKTAPKKAIREAVVDAWLTAAPPDLAQAYLAGPSASPRSGRSRTGTRSRGSRRSSSPS